MIFVSGLLESLSVSGWSLEGGDSAGVEGILHETGAVDPKACTNRGIHFFLVLDSSSNCCGCASNSPTHLTQLSLILTLPPWCVSPHISKTSSLSRTIACCTITLLSCASVMEPRTNWLRSDFIVSVRDRVDLIVFTMSWARGDGAGFDGEEEGEGKSFVGGSEGGSARAGAAVGGCSGSSSVFSIVSMSPSLAGAQRSRRQVNTSLRRAKVE
jgi:hypothetical protein